MFTDPTIDPKRGVNINPPDVVIQHLAIKFCTENKQKRLLCPLFDDRVGTSDNEATKEGRPLNAAAFTVGKLAVQTAVKPARRRVAFDKKSGAAQVAKLGVKRVASSLQQSN
jgi:hypothetical protein